jgi:SPOR domain
MADQDYDTYRAYAQPQAFAPARMMHIAGGVTSVALVIGMAVWGYKLAVRDVAGIPVVRAMEGPMRIAPDTPGGDVAAHQGLAVNDVAALGSATPLPEALSLAPRPVDLTDEDIAGLGRFAAAEDPSLVTASAGLSDPAIFAAPSGEITSEAVEAALAEALTPEEAMAFATSDLLDAGAPLTSLIPRRRPGAAAAVPITDVQDVVAVTQPEVDAATLAAGTPLVQLGTFRTNGEARAEWARLAGRFGDLMAAKSVVLQAADSGGSPFVRLRAHGFASEDDARRFCTALLAENTSCLPTLHR